MDMSGDELLLSVLCAVGAIILWVRWYVPLRDVGRPGRRSRAHVAIAAAPLLCAVVVLVVLMLWSSFDVRDDLRYLFMYGAMGATWLAASVRVQSYLGLSARDDVVERRNLSAGVAVSGALVGTTLCFSGANIGDGPGWLVVVLAAALSTGGLMLAWLVLEWLTGISETITVERDLAAGIRLAGLLVALGLILGRAVAGDFTTVDRMLADFRDGIWLVPVLLAVATAFERLARPTPAAPQAPPVALGVLPALIYLTAALAYVSHAGMPA